MSNPCLLTYISSCDVASVIQLALQAGELSGPDGDLTGDVLGRQRAEADRRAFHELPP